MRSAVLRAHTYGVKTYLTLNTLVTDREMSAFVDAARDAARAGIDALIVADLGGAAAIHRALPSLELHASTQMSGHNGEIGKLLGKIGFSRMVVARETSLEDLSAIVQKSPIEIEYFIHGALCVSHSGQCLFSSMVGGRSGNRGECAQPCRLPYSCAGCSQRSKEEYPLSLKDLSLASHVPELIATGVSSLKIEGRMKSPEYVRDTARIWRVLLDENRNATPQEMQRLSDVFSRGGFTDGYFTGRIGHGMLGIRSDTDKLSSRAAAPFEALTRKIPLTLSAELLSDTPGKLTISDGTRSVSVCGEIPLVAQNAPLTKDSVERSLTKFGGTPYSVERFSLRLDEGLMLPISRLNDLRRRALQAWEESLSPLPPVEAEYTPALPKEKRGTLRTARFQTAEQITSEARAFFERIYLPLFRHATGVEGVVVPPVVFDRDEDTVRVALKKAAENGARYALIGNLGHLALSREAGLVPVGDFRLNATNAESVRRLEELGFEGAILSPEMTLPQIRDVGGKTEAIVYGRIPLMLLEKCVIKEIADCKKCDGGAVLLKDRRGYVFPVLREWEHRNVVYNSLPTSMSDRKNDLERFRITVRHFLFSTESPGEVDAVIRAFRHGNALPNCRRI